MANLIKIYSDSKPWVSTYGTVHSRKKILNQDGNTYTLQIRTDLNNMPYGIMEESMQLVTPYGKDILVELNEGKELVREIKKFKHGETLKFKIEECPYTFRGFAMRITAKQSFPAGMENENFLDSRLPQVRAAFMSRAMEGKNSTKEPLTIRSFYDKIGQYLIVPAIIILLSMILSL